MANKSTKTQLIAIYRLEFYKNKKNWKLCDNVQKEPPSPSPKTLNETYNVEEFNEEPDYEPEQVSPHNKAFLLEEPDDSPDLQPPDSEVSALPASDYCQYDQHSWGDQPWSGDKSEATWQDVQQEPCQKYPYTGSYLPFQLHTKEWCGAEAEGMPEEFAYDQCEGPCRQHMWPPVSQYDHVKSECDPLDTQLEYLSPAEMLHTAEEWLQRHGCPVLEEEYAPYYEQYGLLDESAEFVRGAHHAPHSSEVDLSVTHDECACACGRVCELSPRELSRAVARHHAALARLLSEHALRDALYSQSTLLPPTPLEEYPTRDTDPLRPPDGVLSGSHRALSGSHRALSGPHRVLSGPHRLPDAGRGRGRLQHSNRVIGIGMGRPYRL